MYQASLLPLRLCTCFSFTSLTFPVLSHLVPSRPSASGQNAQAAEEKEGKIRDDILHDIVTANTSIDENKEE